MGKNEELGLPFGKMAKVAVCFDVDGTLIEGDKVHDTTQALLLAFAAQKWKNVDLIIWSGGGADYARTQYDRFMRFSSTLYPHIRFHSKLEYSDIRAKYDLILAIDDIQDTALGDINLIPRNK